jgi:hypothetical protein
MSSKIYRQVVSFCPGHFTSSWYPYGRRVGRPHIAGLNPVVRENNSALAENKTTITHMSSPQLKSLYGLTK